MENLLTTQFIIKNCTLAQRTAIKAFCDEKGIKYFTEATLTTTREPHLKWNGEQFLQLTDVNKYKIKEISFSEVIQILDKYQGFKIGDFVVANGADGNGFRGKVVSKLEAVGIKKATGMFSKESDFSISVENEQLNIKTSHIERYATPEEIQKWKDENEINKLPKIGDYSGEHSTTKLKWGCTEISISTVKELLGLKITSITLDNDVQLDYALIQQISKFITHNNL